MFLIILPRLLFKLRKNSPTAESRFLFLICFFSIWLQIMLQLLSSWKRSGASARHETQPSSIDQSAGNHQKKHCTNIFVTHLHNPLPENYVYFPHPWLDHLWDSTFFDSIHRQWTTSTYTSKTLLLKLILKQGKKYKVIVNRQCCKN